MVKNWSFISAWLSGNQSQFNFETLIATETNYEQQDLKPLIKVGVNKVIQHCRWGISRRQDEEVHQISSQVDQLNQAKRETLILGMQLGSPKWGLQAPASGERAG